MGRALESFCGPGAARASDDNRRLGEFEPMLKDGRFWMVAHVWKHDIGGVWHMARNTRRQLGLDNKTETVLTKAQCGACYVLNAA